MTGEFGIKPCEVDKIHRNISKWDSKTVTASSDMHEEDRRLCSSANFRLILLYCTVYSELVWQLGLKWHDPLPPELCSQ
ncbi:Tumor necrosis factor receptor superfamily member [Trichinella spiralis]|uniref:Tumor necrosis factor receptor superfamily member n=1 Tax=Trichinella spiralis TaxID=6334 RepID=A0ABR3KD42_TRISP